MGVILIVTWLAQGQPPVTTQTPFRSMAACEVARAAVQKDRARLVAEERAAVRRTQEQLQFPGVVKSSPIPMVTAVCAAQ